MNVIDLANGLIFNKLEIKTIDELSDRIILQKKIYLLQSLDVDLGYNYNWYLKGPYSPDLTEYAYKNIEILNNYDYTDKKLKEDIEKTISDINCIGKEIPNNMSKDEWYELIASIVYIFKNDIYWGGIESALEAFNILKKEKPQYGDEELFKNALTTLQNYNFLRNIQEKNKSLIHDYLSLDKDVN